ncbi:MAG: hypothetical protein KGJ57_22840 [Sphingomonadales bacterium]|nr:hypothetical protein [Sphingomonadales bacterium]MDE2172223.1 hypothetical protein [Sphingomonadales bacterium]
MSKAQSVDPAVTRTKFDLEVGLFREMEATYRRRGILLQEVAFPTVTIAFCGARLKPPPLLGAVRIDFTDYDLQPPSVTFVDPLTHSELAPNEVLLSMFRLSKRDGMSREEVLKSATQDQPVELIPMVMANEQGGKPFLCLPGVREYHDNPAHSGDPWLLHRASGEGCLAFIVDNIWKYGPNVMEAYMVQVAMQGGGTTIQAQVQAKQVGVAAGLASVPE